MWTEQQILSALDAARCVVRADGADLELVAADPRRSRITLRLDVTHLRCDDGGACLVPKHLLVPLIAAQVQQVIAGEVEVRLEDPRESA